MGRPSTGYPAEVRERAVRLVFEHGRRVRLAVGGDVFDRDEVWLHGRDAAAVPRPGCKRCQPTPGPLPHQRSRLPPLPAGRTEPPPVMRPSILLNKSAARFPQAWHPRSHGRCLHSRRRPPAVCSGLRPPPALPPCAMPRRAGRYLLTMRRRRQRRQSFSRRRQIPDSSETIPAAQPSRRQHHGPWSRQQSRQRSCRCPGCPPRRRERSSANPRSGRRSTAGSKAPTRSVSTTRRSVSTTRRASPCWSGSGTRAAVATRPCSPTACIRCGSPMDATRSISTTWTAVTLSRPAGRSHCGGRT